MFFTTKISFFLCESNASSVNVVCFSRFVNCTLSYLQQYISFRMLLNTKFTKIINENERTAAAGIESVVSSYAIYKRSWFRDSVNLKK